MKNDLRQKLPPVNERGILDWAECLRAGDESALNPLVCLAQSRLYRFCFHLTGDVGSAEEMAQEAFLRVYLKIKDADGFGSEEEFFAWLFTIAKNKFLSFKRTATGRIENRSGRTSERGVADFHFKSPESETADVETLLDVQKALNTLSEKERMIVLLVDHEEYSYDEAAEIMGITKPALCAKLLRARGKILGLLGEESQP